METTIGSADVSTLIVGLALIAVVVTRSQVRRALAVLPGVVAMLGWWALAGAALWFGGATVAAAVADGPPRAMDPGDPCPAGAQVRVFNISLINIPLFLNRFGDVIPEGRMYVLDENILEVRDTFADAANPNQIEDLIEPLTVRVNHGDCVQVEFSNLLDEPAPPFDRDDSIFSLPGETLLAAGSPTDGKREFAPALSQPHNDFDHTSAPDASMHFDGLDYDVTGSDGTAVGNNPNSTVPAGQSTTYRLYADTEGQWQFVDGADFSSVQTGAGNFIGSHGFGAFGAIVVEPPGTTWVDARTGGPLASGTRAIIKDPAGADSRETVLFMHDELEAEPGILTRFCVPGGGWNRGGDDGAADDNSDSVVGGPGDSCVRPNQAEIDALSAGTLDDLSGGDADALIDNGAEQIPVKLEWFAFNYRSEPGFNREEVGCPAGVLEDLNNAPVPECIGEETSLSSWTFGDPGGGDLVWASYRGEPTQIRLVHTAEFETHTFHWHVNRWPLDPADEGGLEDITDPGHHTAVTNPIDVQAVSPGDAYTLIPEGGAGSRHDEHPGTFGDVIFHCHLYPHFANGMWGLNRTHDVLQDGQGTNPDGTPIPPLEPLDDFDYQEDTGGTNPPLTPTAAKPGFPHFIPGTFGLKAPKPPLGVASRQNGQPAAPTTLEQDAAAPNAQVPGGFFQDPCPAFRSDNEPTPVKTFYVEAIELPQTYNPDLEWTNPQSRIYVGGTTPQELADAKDAVLVQREKPEPFSPLLNVGDCVVYHLTNDLPLEFGGTVFDREQITNEVGIHQHMVQFDVLSSDGTANGWNYDQGADANDPTQSTLTTSDTTITYRDFVHEDTATNSFHDHFFPNIHQDNGLFGGSTIHPPGCTFHNPNDGWTGDPGEPRNSPTVAIGTIVDIACEPATDYHGNPTDGESYRNFSLFIEDHVPMFQPEDPADPNDDNFVTPDGVPIFPAKFPSAPDDYGAMGINYRLEPFEARRIDKDGNPTDPSRFFDSSTHAQLPEVWDVDELGDPTTPVLNANNGDRIKFRLFQLSQEESHGFNLDRFSWDFEPNDPDSKSVQAQHIGMLEYFDLRVNVDAAEEDYWPFDYVYNYGGSDDWFLGAWGILRVHNCRWAPNLYAPPAPSDLSDNPVKWCTIPPEPLSEVETTNDLCPSTAPIKQFEISAINFDIEYNDSGDHDPHGLMYAPTEDVDQVRNGLKKPEPLVIRANAGDCIQITLHNELDPNLMEPHCHDATEPGQLGFKEGVLTFPACIDEPPNNEHNVPGFQPLPVSDRVGLRPTLVGYNVQFSDGSNAGYNNHFWGDSTVGPGGTGFYQWYAPEETGLAVLQDRGDVQSHLHHGLYGALVVEPAGSSYLDPETGAPLGSGADAVIVDPNGPDFREHVVLMNSDLALFRDNGDPVPDNLDLELGASREADDPEDQGEFSINYRNEPWSHRFNSTDPDAEDLSLIFSSVVHGDPATPLFQAYAGDPVRFRVAQAVGKPRSTGFALHGHKWRRSPNDPESEVTASQGQFNPVVTHNIHLDPALHGGAGGPDQIAGDYLYRTGTLQRHMIGGQWGIFRVHGTVQPDLIELPDRAVSLSRARRESGSCCDELTSDDAPWVRHPE